MSEQAPRLWTDDDARAAVGRLSDELVDALAEGPLEDPDDCRVCAVFDPWLFGFGGPDTEWQEDECGDFFISKPDPNSDPVFLLVEYHRDQADNGYGDEAFRRCQVVYEAARNVRRERENP